MQYRIYYKGINMKNLWNYFRSETICNHFPLGCSSSFRRWVWWLLKSSHCVSNSNFHCKTIEKEFFINQGLWLRFKLCAERILGTMPSSALRNLVIGSRTGLHWMNQGVSARMAMQMAGLHQVGVLLGWIWIALAVIQGQSPIWLPTTNFLLMQLLFKRIRSSIRCCIWLSI